MSGQTPSLFDYISPEFLRGTDPTHVALFRQRENQGIPPGQGLAFAYDAVDDARLIILGTRRGLRGGVNGSQLANYIGFENNLKEREAEIRQTRFGSAAYITDITVLKILKRYEGDLPSIVANSGPNTAEKLIRELTKFCDLTRNSTPVDFQNLQTGLAALGTVISASDHCGVEKVTPDLFRQLQSTISLLRENRGKPVKKAISITREQALGLNPEAVEVVDPEDFSRNAFDKKLHNDPKFRFLVKVNDERGEPIREEAGDSLIRITGKHEWLTVLATGKEMNWEMVERLRARVAEAEAAKIKAAKPEVQPLVIAPFVLADRFVDAAQKVTTGEPAAATGTAREGMWKRLAAALHRTSRETAEI